MGRVDSLALERCDHLDYICSFDAVALTLALITMRLFQPGL